MGQFTESLTIRILGDSEGLQRELESATRAVEEFRERLSEVSDWSSQLGDTIDSVGSVQGLEQVNNALERIRSQMLWINNTPLVINVAPALANLEALSTALDAIIFKLMLIRALGGGVSLGGGGGGGAAPVAPAAQFASGGVVTGPAGIDRVPAMLTAGEFVISSPAVRELGEGFLWALNESPLRTMDETRNRSLKRAMYSPSANQGGVRGGSVRTLETSRHEIMHVGGVTINVNQGIDPESALRNLRLQGISLRNRRG